MRPARGRHRGLDARPVRPSSRVAGTGLRRVRRRTTRRWRVGRAGVVLAGAVPPADGPRSPLLAHQGDGGSPDRPHRRVTRARSARALDQGSRRERDDRRPRAQRPRPRVHAGHDPRARPRARRGPPRRVAPRVRRRRHARARHRRRRPPAGVLPARLGDRRAQGGRDGDHRHHRDHRSRGLHGRDRLRQPGGRTRAERRHPHLRAAGRPDLAGRRGRRRRRLHPRRRVGRVPAQGSTAPAAPSAPASIRWSRLRRRCGSGRAGCACRSCRCPAGAARRRSRRCAGT